MIPPLDEHLKPTSLASNINTNIGIMMTKLDYLQNDLNAIKKYVSKAPTRDEFEVAKDRLNVAEQQIIILKQQVEILQEYKREAIERELAELEKLQAKKAFWRKMVEWIFIKSTPVWFWLIILGVVIYDVFFGHVSIEDARSIAEYVKGINS